jgi:hypothetical protein
MDLPILRSRLKEDCVAELALGSILQISDAAHIPRCGKLRRLYLSSSKHAHRGNQMKKLSTALLAAGLLTLGACGSSEEAPTTNNSVEDVNLTTDDLTATDNLAGTETLGNQADALGSKGGNGTGAADANLTETSNAADNALGNAAGNSQ